MPRPLLSRPGASIHHQDSGRTFIGRKISVLWIHAAEIHQDRLPAPFSRRQQRHLTEQLGRIREQQSINLSKHVSILGLQTVADAFTSPRDTDAINDQKRLRRHREAKETIFLL